ncbi:MAG: cysteine--tRNA ligase [bacterium]
MKIYNTLNRKVEEFTPMRKGKVGMYNCGPTVYWHMHVGNLRAYAFVDLFRRTLIYLGYDVNQVMNLTDVGHLTEDDNEEEKMEKAAEREGKTVWDIAKYYTDSVYSDFEKMNYHIPDHVVKATDMIPEIITLIKKIEENGFTYETKEAVYFDVTKVPEYTKLQGGQKLEDKLVGVREEVNVDLDKKHPADFALWLKAVGKYKNHVMKWNSPWGEGFPGWHIECSTIGMKFIGEKIDIHTGGEDHPPVHHTNERAQNFGATGTEVVNFWVHNAFMLIDSGKMSKSLGNVYNLNDVEEKGFDPMDLKYLYLTANYRTKQNFTWENLKSAQVARKSLVSRVNKLKELSLGRKGKVDKEYKEKFTVALEDDLNTPLALSVVWEMMKDEDLIYENKLATILDFDKVFGLRLDDSEIKVDSDLKQKVEKLVKEREEAREKKEWDKADSVRDELVKMGVEIEDTPEGTKWTIKE